MENRTFVFPVSASDNILIDFGAKIMYIICTHQEGIISCQPSRPGHGGQECAKAEKQRDFQVNTTETRTN
jgi:hypothetical protein